MPFAVAACRPVRFLQCNDHVAYKVSSRSELARYVAPRRDGSRPFTLNDRYLRRTLRHATAAIERATKLRSELHTDGEASSCLHSAMVALREWLIDSGSAFHLLSEQDMSEKEAESQFTPQSPDPPDS